MKGILEGKFIADSTITEDKLSHEVVNKLNEEIEIVQNTGNDSNVVMSQKAVTDALNTKADSSLLSSYLPLSGGTLTGNLNINTASVNGSVFRPNADNNTILGNATYRWSDLYVHNIVGKTTYNGSEIATVEDIPTDYVKPSELTNSLSNYVPITRTVNGKALNANITLTATDVGAATTSAIPTVTQTTGTSTTSVISQKGVTDALNLKANASDIPTDYVPNTRTINGKALNANINLTATDVGAAATSDLNNKLDFSDVYGNSNKTQITIGNNTSSTNSHGIAIGSSVKINTPDTDSIGVGNGSSVEPIDLTESEGNGTVPGPVSFGRSDDSIVKRRLINVADGVNENDVTTVAQMERALGTKANTSDVSANYVPITRTVNGKPLNTNITLSASDVGAAASSALSSYVPTTRTVNGKSLSSNITLTASDVGAATTSAIPSISTSLSTSTTTTICPNAVASALYNDPSTRYRVQLGNGASSTGTYSVVVGRNTSASGNYSLGLGYNTSATGSYGSIGIGYNVNTSETSSIGIGQDVTVSGKYSVGIGPTAKATEDYSTAVGPNPTASGLHSIALGYSAQATGDYSIAIGRLAQSSEYRCTAIGFRSKVHASDIIDWDYELGVVSVGDSEIGDRKRIINVRPGRNANDAATYNQISSTRSANLELMSELLEIVEQISGQNVSDSVQTRSTNVNLSDKLSSLKSKVKQEIEEIKDWEKEQEEYYATIQKKAKENEENINT